MGRITEIGSLVSSPIKELRARGKKRIERAVEKAGSFVAAAQVLGVSERQMFRWAAKLKLRSPAR